MLVQFHSSNNECASTHMPRGQHWALRTLPSTSFCTYRLFRNKACAYSCLMYYLLLKLFIIKQTSKKSFIKKQIFTKCTLRLGTCEVMERDSKHKPLQQEKDQEATGVKTKYRRAFHSWRHCESIFVFLARMLGLNSGCAAMEVL